MKRFIVILGMFALLLVSLSNAQQRWERNYGGTGADMSYFVQQTQDGGYIVAGFTNSFGDNNQVYLIKTNASGDTLWTRTYGGASGDDGSSVQQTLDGGYIVTGTTASFGNYLQVYLIKTNSSGDTLWTKTYGGAGNDQGWSVQQTSDSGYIVAGWTGSSTYSPQVYLIKTNASGDTLWTKTHGGVYNDYGYSVQQTADGGYIVVGNTDSFRNSWQVYLVKTNASGDLLWERNYGGDYGQDDGYFVQQTTDGGYIVAGLTECFGNDWQVYLIKTNPFGDTLWTRTYGGAGIDLGSSVQQTSDGGYVVAAFTTSFGNGYQVYLIKTNPSGDTLWTRTYGGTGYDGGNTAQQTSDGGYIVAGQTESFGTGGDVYLIKTDSLGRSSGVEENTGVRGQGLGIRLTAKPNPFTSFASLPGHEAERFSLYDISGRKVGIFRGDRVGEGLGPGVYFVCKGTACRAPTTAPLRIVKVR